MAFSVKVVVIFRPPPLISSSVKGSPVFSLVSRSSSFFTIVIMWPLSPARESSTDSFSNLGSFAAASSASVRA